MKLLNGVHFLGHGYVSHLVVVFLLLFSGLPAVAGTITLYYTDANGSPVAAADVDGNILWREHYEPYGKKLNRPSGEDVGYTGHEFDRETGLTYMQARYYDPEVGRFLAIDPVGYKPGQPMTFNRYSYANNNPYKYVDPDGRNVTTAFGGVLYESAQWVQGEGFNGEMVMGALADGYNGEGSGFAAALGEDVLNFVPAGAAVKMLRLSKSVLKAPKGAFQTAQQGGRHAGQLNQFMKQTTAQLQKTIKSFDKQIAKHEGWIKNPTSKVRNFNDLLPEHQQNLIHHWEQDIARHKELISIAQDVLKRR